MDSDPTFQLALSAGQLKALEPVDFVVQVKEDERVLIDQMSLVPEDAISGLDPEMVGMSKAMKTSAGQAGGNYFRVSLARRHWFDGQAH